MNPRTIPSCNAALPFVAAVEGQTPITGFPVDFQDLCSLGMDRALGIEKASLDKATRCKKASWFVPIPGKLFDVATEAIASYMKLQMNWMILCVPRASLHVGKAASNSDSQAKPTAEVLERSMDIAIGQQQVAVSPQSWAGEARFRAGKLGNCGHREWRVLHFVGPDFEALQDVQAESVADGNVGCVAAAAH